MNTNLSQRVAWSALFGLCLLAGCGRATDSADYKLPGVGLNPDEIGPEPTEYGGLIEYNWVELAGSALPLGLLGLVSYEAAGPQFADFKPPYALVSGLGFVMVDDLPNIQTLVGTFGTPPAVEGTCRTTYSPTSFLNSVVDVGNAITFAAEDGSSRFEIARRPEIYPPNVQNVFTYYLALEAWRATARTWYPGAAAAATTTLDYSAETLQKPNFAFGERYDISFPGGLPPIEASFGSIPMPLGAAGKNRSITLPHRPTGVMLRWNGPRFDENGDEISAGGEVSTCLQYISHDTDPTSVADCLSLQEAPTDGSYPSGQMYTGPWDTEQGVTFEWQPALQGAQDIVTISVRFLGPVETDDVYKLEAVVEVPPSQDVTNDWKRAQANGEVPPGAELPQGYRPALPCDDPADVKWVFDPSLKKGDGSYVNSLQGDPTDNLVEVTCRVSDADGSFTLTEDMLAEAMAYAKQHDAQGAIFYFNRSTAIDLETPAVRDNYGQRRDIGPVRVVSNAVQIGRFWYDL